MSAKISVKPRECHKCPRFGKGDDYCWKVCPGPAEISDKGHSFVRLGSLPAPDEFIAKESVDDGRDSSAVVESELDDDYDPFFDEETPEDTTCDTGEPTDTNERNYRTGAVTATLSDEVERALVVVIANLFGEDDATSDIQLILFKRFFHGFSLREAGASLPKIGPISKQAVHAHINKMIARNSVFSKVLMRMKEERIAGARGTIVQGELFDTGGTPDSFDEAFDKAETAKLTANGAIERTRDVAKIA